MPKGIRTLLAGLVVLLGLTIPALPASAETRTLDAGAIEVQVETAPFAISFVERSTGETLRTLGGQAPGPQNPAARYGPLGFSFDLRIPILNNAYFGYYLAVEGETLWFHATEATSVEETDGGLDVLAATNDPLGHELRVRIETVADGVVRVNARPVGPLADSASLAGGSFEAADDDHYLGLGSRSNAVDQRGNEVFNWAEEGPFSSGDAEDVLRPLLPDFTFPTGPTATNFPVPFVMLSRGFGFLIDQTHRSRFRFESERGDAWQAETETNRFQFMVFAGPDPADALRRYSAYTGPQPKPKPWIFGPWFQPTGESRRYELADLWREKDVPVTVTQTYLHYLPCGSHVGRDDQPEFTDGYHQRGYKVTTYFNPHVCTSYQPVYDELAERSLFVENGLGEPYILSNPFTADEIISEFDFTNPAAREAFGGLLDEAIDDGYDGWMEDFGEYTPTDSKFDNGKDGKEMHNLYPVLYHGTSYRHTRNRMGKDAAVFVRSGWHGSQPVSRIVWGGDPTEDWSCADGLCAAVHQLVNMGLTGFAYQGSDIGGFHAVVNPRTDDELNIRWLQAGAVSGVMRTQANGYSFMDDRDERSQVWHDDVLPIWRKFAKLRTQLLPYIEAASRKYQRTGLPIAQHPVLAYPDDPRVAGTERELLFGPDLFVAPVVEPGQRERSFYLPGGKWVDFWGSVQYRPKRGVFRPDEVEMVKGGKQVTLDAPLDEMPMLVKAGAVIPLLSADVDTLANTATGPYPEPDVDARTARAKIPGKRDSDLVEVRDRKKVMRLLAFPRGRSTAEFGGKGEKLVSKERGGSWTLKIKGKRNRTYFVRASTGAMKDSFTPCRATLDGKRLAPGKWGFSKRRDVIRAKVGKLKRGKLRFESCSRGR